MGTRHTRSTPTWSLLLLAACASSSALPRAVTIPAGERVRVVLLDVARNRAFALQNLSSGSRREIYADTGNDTLVKVVDDTRLQQLLDVLAARGMFERAGDAPVPGARAAIAVELQGRRLVWSRPVPNGTNTTDVQAFEEGRGYVLAIYNDETAYQKARIDDFAPDTRGRIERAKAGTTQPGQSR